jgi:chromate transporter
MSRENQEAPSLWLLFSTFFKMGAVTFGGGYAMLPILQREVVEKHGWATDEELADYYAIGQCTPGVLAVNTATFIGYKSRGIIGGIMATFGVVAPSLLIIMTLAGVIAAFADNPYVVSAFNGIRACVCVLILSAVMKLWKKSITDGLTLGIFLIALAASMFVNASPILIIIVDMVFGLILALVGMRRTGAKGDEK